MKDAAAAKLDNTSLSTGVFQRVLLKTPALPSCLSNKIYKCLTLSFIIIYLAYSSNWINQKNMLQ